MSTPKGFAQSNRIILGKHAAACAFWGLTAFMTVSIVVATFWLLTHPLA